jgi:hypothetical protein
MNEIEFLCDSEGTIDRAKKKEKRQKDKQEKFLASSIASVKTVKQDMVLSKFYKNQDKATIYMLICTRFIFFFLITVSLILFFYTQNNILNIKKLYQIQVSPFIFADKITLIQKQILALFLIQKGKDEFRENNDFWVEKFEQ